MDPASCKRLVMLISSWDGSRRPEGWLWATNVDEYNIHI